MNNQWQVFFDGHAPVYMENSFTKNTVAEVDFLLDEFALPPGSRILEIGCGTGRHSVETARRGYRITGIDISAGMLAEAAKAATAAGVEVEFIQADAMRFEPEREAYDAAICLCEGAFGLLGQEDDPDAHDLSILRNVHAGLKPGAPFMLTTLSAFRVIRAAQVVDDQWVIDRESGETFDPLTLHTTCRMPCDTPEGAREIIVHERVYLPGELSQLFRQAGFTIAHIWGGTAGNWGRRPIDPDEYEMMVVARKG